jgi:hypothetical protein
MNGEERRLPVWRLRDILRRGRRRHKLRHCREEFRGLWPGCGRALFRSQNFAGRDEHGQECPRYTNPRSYAAAPLRNDSMAFSSLS